MAFAQDTRCEVVTRNAVMEQMLAHDDPRRPNVRILHRGRPVEPAQLPLNRAAALGQTVLAMELEIAVEGQPPTFVLANAVPLRDRQGRPVLGLVPHRRERVRTHR